MNHVLHPSALRSAVVMALMLAAYSGLAVWKERSDFAETADFPAGLEAAVSLVIGLLLAFRANRAFDRWWEGRILWGTLVNACRNLAVKINRLADGNDESVARVEELLVAFAPALRDHLRGVSPQNSLPGLPDEADQPRHVPAWIVNQLYGIIAAWSRDGKLRSDELWMLDREAKVLLEVCGGCERIRNTPIARSYRVFLHQALGIFLLSLPWGIVDDFDGWTIPIVFLTSYFVIAADCVAQHVEQPFGANGDALDLDGICQTIDRTVREILSDNRAVA